MLTLSPALSLYRQLVAIISLLFWTCFAMGQNNDHFAACDILPEIDSQIVNFNSDTTLSILLSSIDTHCNKDPKCLIEHYQKLSYKLERKFLLYAAIYVEGEIIKQAQIMGDKKTEAESYLDLSRFNDAKGYSKLGAINLDKAIETSQECDCHQIYIQASFYKYR